MLWRWGVEAVSSVPTVATLRSNVYWKVARVIYLMLRVFRVMIYLYPFPVTMNCHIVKILVSDSWSTSWIISINTSASHRYFAVLQWWPFQWTSKWSPYSINPSDGLDVSGFGAKVTEILSSTSVYCSSIIFRRTNNIFFQVISAGWWC